MNKVPKEIVDKIEQRNKLNKEIMEWCNENLDMEGMDSDFADITDYHTGCEQGGNNCKEWCDQDKVVEQLEDYGNDECAYYENTPYKNVIVECIGKAIEIVKGGGDDAKTNS
jgi:hypothetical protein|nr:MAG TPA: hypothetical protein [Caudoviricetes sp.]